MEKGAVAAARRWREEAVRMVVVEARVRVSAVNVRGADIVAGVGEERGRLWCRCGGKMVLEVQW